MPYVPLPHAGRVHYAERGEPRPGATPALFIHGAGASSAIWNMVLARVARATRAVAIDLPGHGPSDPAPEPSLAAYRDATGALAGTLCLGPSVLVGHSLGALVAIEAAIEWPDKVRALVLAGAAPRLRVDPAFERILRDAPADAPAWLAEHALSPRAKPAVRRGFLAAGLVAPLDATRADYAIVAATDLSDRLAHVRCPMIWIDGADDRLVPAADGRPGEHVSVPDAGHVLPIEAPAAIAEVVGSRCNAPASR